MDGEIDIDLLITKNAMEVPVLGTMERLMSGELRQLHNEERHIFNTSPSISSLTTVV
jgi:hypothetical protein